MRDNEVRVDFTSSLYLGFRHSSASLKPWHQLTTGMPAFLNPSSEADEVGHTLARLAGCDSGILAPSTSHLFSDIFAILGDREFRVFVDSGAYPTVRWGTEHAAARGTPVCDFPHFDAPGLAQKLRSTRHSRLRPVVVTDGFCPACGRPAPLADYHRLVSAFGGYLIIDDTQGIGVLGDRAHSRYIYGKGGGGTVPWSGISGPEVVVIGSLAKAFGVPAAFLAGTDSFVEFFRKHSGTQIHSSPPSASDISAAQRAIRLNAERGDALRLRLQKLVARFRFRVERGGLRVSRGAFPFQAVAPTPRTDAVAIQLQLWDLGVRSLLYQGHGTRKPSIGFLITAAHQSIDIEHSVRLLVRIAAQTKSPDQWSHRIRHRQA